MSHIIGKPKPTRKGATMKKREWIHKCESGKYGASGDNIVIIIGRWEQITYPMRKTRVPMANLYMTEAGAGEFEGEACDAETRISLTAEGLRRLARDLEEAAADLDRMTAEDRSKPAPGWTVEEYGGDGHAPVWAAHCPGQHAYKETEAEAIAWTWEQHDVQQAGEGGES